MKNLDQLAVEGLSVKEESKKWNKSWVIEILGKRMGGY